MELTMVRGVKQMLAYSLLHSLVSAHWVYPSGVKGSFPSPLGGGVGPNCCLCHLRQTAVLSTQYLALSTFKSVLETLVLQRKFNAHVAITVVLGGT